MDDRAEVGLTSLILFIGAVIVTATAVGLLMRNSNELQQRAFDVGSESSRQASSALEIEGVYGALNADRTRIATLHVFVHLVPGADALNLTPIRIRYAEGANPALMLAPSGTAGTPGTASATEFALTWRRTAETGASRMLAPGDVVEFTVSLAAIGSGYELPVGRDAQLRIVPPTGLQIDASFSSPPTFPATGRVELR